jgi:hypothetical protein
MAKTLDEACNLADSFVLDDSANLLKIMLKCNPGELSKFNAELIKKENEKEGVCYLGHKYKFYNPMDVSEVIDFILSNKINYSPPSTCSLISKIVQNADPRGYFNTVCINYDTEEAYVSSKPSKDKKKGNVPMTFNTNNNKNTANGKF